jgi:hypothetical protein
MTFTKAGEAVLSQWMADHARVVWHPNPEPWRLEEHLIRTLVVPLNLDQNQHCGFHSTLAASRAAARKMARERPVAGD